MSTCQKDLDAFTKAFAKRVSVSDVQDIFGRLSKLPCPMVWEAIEYYNSLQSDSYQYKRSEWIESLNETPRLPIMLVLGKLLALSLINFYDAKYDEGLALLLDFTKEEEPLGTNDKFNKSLKDYADDGFCIINATISWFYFKLDRLDKCVKYLKMSKNLYNPQKNYFYQYVKADTLSSFEKKGINTALCIMEKVIKVNENPIFHLKIGQLMGKVRHFTFPWACPTQKEFNHLQIAYKQDPSNELSAVLLLRCYRDMYKRTSGSEREEYICKADTISRKLLTGDLDNLQGSTIARLLFMMLSHDLKYSELLDCAARLALTKRPHHILVNDYIGRFYLFFKMYDKAIPCLEVGAKCLPYSVGILLLSKYRLNKEDNFKSIIDDYLKLYSKKDDLYSFYASVSEFYLLICRDYEKSAHYFLKMCNFGPLQKYTLTLCSFTPPLFEVFNRMVYTSQLSGDVYDVKSMIRKFIKSRCKPYKNDSGSWKMLDRVNSNLL